MRKKTFNPVALDHLNYTVQMIDSDKLVSPEETYQRPLNEKRVAQIAAEWDDNIANEPKVSLRDGHYYLFDGHHTVAARVKRNDGKPLEIRCKVYSGLTAAQEAMLFAAQTGRAALPTPGKRLRARIYAKDEDALAFRQATESAGFVLNLDGHRSDDHISCINTALRMFHKLTLDQYEQSLSVLRAAWDGKADSLLNEVIVGVCEFVKHYDGRFNRFILIDALKKLEPRTLHENILSDFEFHGYRRNLAQVFYAYNDSSGAQKLPMDF